VDDAQFKYETALIHLLLFTQRKLNSQQAVCALLRMT